MILHIIIGFLFCVFLHWLYNGKSIYSERISWDSEDTIFIILFWEIIIPCLLAYKSLLLLSRALSVEYWSKQLKKLEQRGKKIDLSVQSRFIFRIVSGLYRFFTKNLDLYTLIVYKFSTLFQSIKTIERVLGMTEQNEISSLENNEEKQIISPDEHQEKLMKIKRIHEQLIDKKRKVKNIDCIICGKEFPVVGKHLYDICRECRDKDKEVKSLRCRYNKTFRPKEEIVEGTLNSAININIQSPTLKDLK